MAKNTSALEEFLTPIGEYNDKLKAASKVARTQVGLVLAGQMLNQLVVLGVSQGDHLILTPTQGFFYNAMIKRKDNILEAIQLVAPEIKYISIIDPNQ